MLLYERQRAAARFCQGERRRLETTEGRHVQVRSEISRGVLHLVEGDRREIGARWRSEQACKDSDVPLHFAPCTCHFLVARFCLFCSASRDISLTSAKKESPSRKRRSGEPEVEEVRASCLVGNCPYRARATPNNRRTTGARPLPSFPLTTTFPPPSSKSTASKSSQPWRPFPSTTRPMEYVLLSLRSLRADLLPSSRGVCWSSVLFPSQASDLTHDRPSSQNLIPINYVDTTPVYNLGDIAWILTSTGASHSTINLPPCPASAGAFLADPLFSVCLFLCRPFLASRSCFHWQQLWS